MRCNALAGILLFVALACGYATPALADGVCDAPFKPGPPADQIPHDTAEEAYAHCVAQAQSTSPSRSTSWEYHEFSECVRLPNGGYQGRAKVWGNWPGGETPCGTSGQMQPYGNIHNYAEECIPPATWNDATKTCFDPDECEKRNQEPGFKDVGPSVRAWSSRCIAGCTFALDPSQGSVQMEGMYSGVFQFTGQQCNAQPMPPIDDGKEQKPQECKPLGGGQTACLKPNGDHCYSAGGGRQICWTPGETGEKTDGPNQQKRDAGPNPIPPNNLQLPSGDTLNKNGNSMTTTTTVNNNGTTNNITTTTTNYNTTNGTNAGPNNSGESNKGDGSGKDGKDGKGASGGGDCKTPPIVTGDPVLGMVATQAWSTRCAVEAGNSVKVTGDVGDCKSPFTVQGTDANAVKLRAMRAQICNEDKDGDGQPDWTKPDGEEGGDPDEDGDGDAEVKGVSVGTDVLDTSGFFGGGSCPSLGTLDFGTFGSFSLDSEPWFCTLVSLMRGVLLLVGAFIALRILTGDVM